MIDNRHLRGIILKLETRLSEDDRTRLHFFLGNDVPRRIRDNPSLRGTLDLIESLFDQDIINENDFTFLINAFDEIRCMDAVKILREHMRCIQSPDVHQSLGSLSLMMPPNLDLLFENSVEDKYAIGRPLLSQSKDSDSSIINEIPLKEVVDSPSPPVIPPKSSSIRKRFFALFLFLSLILLCTLTVFIIIQSNLYTRRLQTNEKILRIEQAKNTELTNNLTILNSRINQTQKDLIIELNHSRILDQQTIHNLLTEQRKNNATIIELRSQGNSNRLIQQLNHLRLKYNQTKQQWINESQQISNEQKLLKNEIDRLQSIREKDRNTILELKETVEKCNRSNENRIKSPRIQIKSTTQWKKDGVSVARRGSEENLNRPCAIRIDDNDQLIIVDCSKHCLWEWIPGALNGDRIAGGLQRGNGDHQLNYPTDVIIDQKEEKLIICDQNNRRIVRWPRRNGRQGETIISDVKCFGMTMDIERFLYVSDIENHEVRRWKIGESTSELIAGGKQQGKGLHQLNIPHFIFITPDRTLFISDWGNHRVMKWTNKSSQGSIIFSYYANGNGLFQLYWSEGIYVDQSNAVYVADCSNNRVLRLEDDGTRVSTIAGGNLRGNGSNEFYCPMNFDFDSLGNLYVADYFNYRIQKFDIEKL